jgi:predicted nucleic acid-binding protein
MNWPRKRKTLGWGIDRMGSHFAVVYDACVLYPAPLRDLLMHLALSDLYRAHWSEKIHDEWTRNVLAGRPDLTPEQLARTRQLMNANVRDSLVEGFEYLIPAIELPDPEDRHVVAAAIHSGASLIVTFNLKTFLGRRSRPINCWRSIRTISS